MSVRTRLFSAAFTTRDDTERPRDFVTSRFVGSLMPAAQYSQCHPGSGQFSYIGIQKVKRVASYECCVIHYSVCVCVCVHVRVTSVSGRGGFKLNRPTVGSWRLWLHKPIKIALVRRHSENDNALSSVV